LVWIQIIREIFTSRFDWLGHEHLNATYFQNVSFLINDFICVSSTIKLINWTENDLWSLYKSLSLLVEKNMNEGPFTCSFSAWNHII